jgi:hypothetical protein
MDLTIHATNVTNNKSVTVYIYTEKYISMDYCKSDSVTELSIFIGILS